MMFPWQSTAEEWIHRQLRGWPVRSDSEVVAMSVLAKVEVSTNGETVPVSVLNTKYDPFFHPKVHDR